VLYDTVHPSVLYDTVHPSVLYDTVHPSVLYDTVHPSVLYDTVHSNTYVLLCLLMCHFDQTLQCLAMLQQLNCVQHNTIHAAALWWHPNKKSIQYFTF